MNKERLKKELTSISLSLFRKDFFGIYHGSISAKLESHLFLINTKNAVFDKIEADDALIELFYNKDYRWKEASLDADIHLNIYRNFSDAKFITFSMPPFVTAYALQHNFISPSDYFGQMEFKDIPIYDPKQFEDWYDRASTEIPQFFGQNKSNIMVIRGYGVYAYGRDLYAMAKQLAILEKSCRLLMLQDNAKLDLDF